MKSALFISSALLQQDILIAPELQPNHPRFGESIDHHFIFTTSFSFPASSFAAYTVVADGRTNIGGLDGDELRPFWTSWKVSELALNMSDSRTEVGQASGRILFFRDRIACSITSRNVTRNEETSDECG
ncbi:hypothetical protein BLNAU_3991 [Blattamonas nauphoetae]|uniref:Uncharacterized protein n=1 Tax=Blattamonas nauphoetae TaxID=2049346 RepID=A0ABQ9YBB3_9EUKA|nr:hypothetical protein BLNAU_3991 [Blattamonas nauphoetae]